MKAGLEIHQQLSTGKLFCRCPSELSEEFHGEFSRRLHATAGETGTSDRAAQAQSARRLLYRYQISPHSCLVEADEEPPAQLDQGALEVALTLAELLGARVVDEVQVMRKIVVDGSNTSGFQRTALIAVDGALELGGRSYSIASICLEEDAARKIAEAPGEVTYRLDRLGIPLLEIATGPDITSGPEAREVAEALGALLRATRRVKRGLGTIREDVNVSIEGGARVEIKGVQELRWIAQFVENEVERQRVLLKVQEELRARAVVASEPELEDVTSIFRTSGSRSIKDTLSRSGAVLALALPGFGGLLGTSQSGPERLGRELADHARAQGVGGIFHSDELPAYGITETEVSAVRNALHLETRDAFVLVAAAPEVARRALRAVRVRAHRALEGVPEETRDPVMEGRTRYSRPLPGRHRMYPETDVPSIAIRPELLQRVREHLPERPAATLERWERTRGLGPEVARQLLRQGEGGVFDRLCDEGRSPALCARLLAHEVPPVEEELGHPVAERDEDRAEVFGPLVAAVEAGKFAKEGLGPVLRQVVLQRRSLDDAVHAAGLVGLSVADLDTKAAQIVESNLALLRERGSGAFQPLMGDLMAAVRGQRDGKEVAAALRKAMDAKLAQLSSSRGAA
jgi:glutamyl-tRNA(Gln) amidotransferase subunit E